MSYSAGNLSIEFLGIDKTASATLDNIIARLERLEKTTANFGKTSNRNSKRSGGGFGFLKIASWTAVFAVARRFGRVVNNIAQAGADYTETLNLWQVAMGNNLDVASEFVNKMNEAYGISEKTLMNAQAIFKNMLGSLGEISDTMAYALSEGITQMALDYASLYNQTFEQAFTKFQAALAGQVRPIRSVAGYDITENTLYQLYQSLGGTKTMRQLSLTEKRLLSILATFNQMNASGAIGDLNKTMESYANQSRVAAEAWQQILSYSGVILTHLIQESGLMTYVNAALIFVGDTLKAVAEDMGAIKSFADPFASTTEGALDASDAMDEVQGKLLDFDEFRSLQGAEENALGLDTKLLEALSGFDSILGNASMEARELAEQFKIASGFFNEDGTFNPDNWDAFAENIENVGTTILLVFGGVLTYKAIDGFVSKLILANTAIKILGDSIALLQISKESGLSLANTADKVGDVSKVVQVLANVLKFLASPLGIILSVVALLYTTNDSFRDSINNLFSVILTALGSTLKPLLDIIIKIVDVLAMVLDVVAEILAPMVDVIASIIQILDQAGILKAVLAVIAIAVAVLTAAIWAQNVAWLANPATWIILGIIAVVTVLGIIIYNVIKNIDTIWEAIKNLARGLGNFFANIGIGIANLFISLVNMLIDVANILLKPLDAVAGLFGKDIQIPKWDVKIKYNPIPEFAKGGLPDKGTMFVAGEAGAEMVYNMPSGQSGVANIQQIAQAMRAGTLQAVKEWWSQARNDIPQFKEVSKTGIYEVAKSEMRRRGEW